MIAAIIVAVLVSRVKPETPSSIGRSGEKRVARKLSWLSNEFYKFLMAAGVSFVPLRHE